MHEYINYLLYNGYSLEESQKLISCLDEKILGNPWNWFPKKPQPQQGLPKTGPSSRLPNRVLPSAEMRANLNRRGKNNIVNQKPSIKPNTYRPGATIRATGPNLDKFPQLQRFAGQTTQIAKPIVKTTATRLASNLIRRSPQTAVAAAVLAPKSTADGTLTSALRRGDYKPMQGPTNPDQGLTKTQSFDKAFKAARTSGKKGFLWNNRTYSTKLKGENIMYNEYDLVIECLVETGLVSSYEDATKFYLGMSDQWIGALIEQMTTQTQFKPLPSSGRTGNTKPPSAPILPPPTSSKQKPKSKPIYNSYNVEGEVIDERRKVDKVAGTPRKPRDPAFELVAKSMGAGRLGVQPRGQTRLQRQAAERPINPETKKPERQRPASAGPTPEKKVEMRRTATQRAQDMQRSRFD